MTRLNSPDAVCIATEFDRSVNTTTANDPELLSSELEQNRAGWERIINCQLIDWGTRMEEFEDEGIDPPSGASIGAGCKIAMNLRDIGLPAPNRVVPTGDGGIAFEIVEGESSTTIEIDEYGEIELIEFHDTKLVNRQVL